MHLTVPHDGGVAPPNNDGGAMPPPPPPPANDGGGAAPPNNDGGAIPPPPANGGGGAAPPNNDAGVIPPPPPPPPPANDGGAAASPNNDAGAIPPPPPPSNEETPPSPWHAIGARWSAELRRVYPWWEAEAARFGEGWEECVWVFVCFEEASGFPAERVRVPVTPARKNLGVDSWINLGRKSWAPSVTATPEQYGKWFWMWWRGLQPEARLIGDGVMSRASDIVWDGIRDLSGKNGMLQVMMVLMWWGAKAHANDASAESRMDWQLAMEDVRWAMDEMVKEGKLSKKRAAERGLLEKKVGPATKKRR
ncbi:hypothetical protein DFH06DRAFT_1385485 [Mycena polygramma]|nr:hypothetical protein DFH06DRAFT_1385485 [Mycena polygramma]